AAVQRDRLRLLARGPPAARVRRPGRALVASGGPRGLDTARGTAQRGPGTVRRRRQPRLLAGLPPPPAPGRPAPPGRPPPPPTTPAARAPPRSRPPPTLATRPWSPG